MCICNAVHVMFIVFRYINLFQAKELIKQQIADDRKARHSRGKVVLSPTESTSGEGGGEGGGGEGEGEGEEEEEEEGGGEVKKSPSSSSASCRLQVCTSE